MKREPHKFAGQTVEITEGEFKGQQYRVEDWWENVAGESWMVCDGNPACLEYAMRGAFEQTPIDNNVLYGKIGAFGKLIHVSQIKEEQKQEAA